jgi:hypothetical protein
LASSTILECSGCCEKANDVNLTIPQSSAMCQILSRFCVRDATHRVEWQLRENRVIGSPDETLRGTWIVLSVRSMASWIRRRAHVGATKLGAACEAEIEEGGLQTASRADEPVSAIRRAAISFLLNRSKIDPQGKFSELDREMRLAFHCCSNRHCPRNASLVPTLFPRAILKRE